MQEGWYDNRPRSFLVYAPCRAAVVYALVEDEAEAAHALVEEDSEPGHALVEDDPEPAMQALPVKDETKPAEE